jgi:peroxiredoxin
LTVGRQSNPQLPCVLASDEDGNAIRALHLVHESFSKVGKTLAVPANILIDEKGAVVWAHYASIVMDRPGPGVVLQKVLALSSNEALLRKK